MVKTDDARSCSAGRVAVMAVLLGFCVALPSWSACAATGTLEARMVTDSAGCPVAVEIWLTAATDTVNGVEAALSWDHPDFLRFQPVQVKRAAADTSADTTQRHLQPRVANQAILDRSHSLMGDWDYAEARSLVGGGVKVTAVAAFVLARHGTPIAPGKTGPLFRLPLVPVVAPAGALAVDSAVLRFDRSKTRISDPRGTLFVQLELKSLVIDSAGAKCMRARRLRH